MSKNRDAKHEPVKIIGTYISPYVRKVLSVLHIKGVPYEIDPISPVYGNDSFSELSPLRRIPVYIDDQITLTDSTVICEYLEERYPETKKVFPASALDKAKARWIEEYCDTKLADIFIWRLFIPARMKILNEHDRHHLELADDLVREIEAAFDYLEGQLPPNGFLFGSVSVADITLAAILKNAMFVGFCIDEEIWPKLHSHVERVISTKEMIELSLFENYLLEQRNVYQSGGWADLRTILKSMGAPITELSLASNEPRAGILRTL